MIDAPNIQRSTNSDSVQTSAGRSKRGFIKKSSSAFIATAVREDKMIQCSSEQFNAFNGHTITRKES
jgi:hypothetical protein